MLEENDFLVFYGSLIHHPPDRMDENLIEDMWRELRKINLLPGDAIANVVRMAFDEGIRVESEISNKEKEVLNEKMRDDFDLIIKLEVEKQQLTKKIEGLNSELNVYKVATNEVTAENKYLKKMVEELKAKIDIV
jgi:hypothetical protein